MKHIERCLFTVKCKEKYFLQIAYIINVAVISVLVMIATGINNVTNDSLSASDLQQLENILSSVIFISALTIVFFQWVVSMQFRALFDSRQQFNNNMRLLGVSPKLLSTIYIRELFHMQPISITIGVLLGEFIYCILASVLGNSNKFIGIIQIAISICIHIVVITCCVLITYKKVAQKDVIASMRTKDDRSSKYELNIIKLVIGIALLIISITMFFIDGTEETKPLALLGVCISIFMLFNAIVYGLHRLLLQIAKKTKKGVLIFSEMISIGYLKKSITVCKLIFFSVSLFLGMQMLYQNVRMCGLNVVESNIKYQSTIWQEDGYYESIEINEYEKKDMFCGLRYKTRHQGTVWYINGVDSNFFGNWENINFYELDEKNDDIIAKFDNENWNGIILPENYVSSSDIGSDIVIEIEGKELSFKIAGSYYSNNLAHWNFYASRAYIQKELQREGNINIIYNKSAENVVDILEKNGVVETYNDIKNESYEQAVNGTTLIEMMSLVIIVCAILAFVNFIMLSSKNDVIDIAMLRGIGLETRRIYCIYLCEAISPIIISIIIAIPTAIIFAKCACLAVLDSYYFQHNYIITYELMLVISVIIVGVSIMARIISIWGATTNKRYVSVLRDIKN